MKLKTLTIAGFGGVAERISIDLDADVVIVVGSNGYGKTTICNAISWVLTGTTDSAQGPRNLYSRSGATFVELEVENAGHNAIISRALANPDESNPTNFQWLLSVQLPEEILKGNDAEVWLKRNFSGTVTDEDYDSIAQTLVSSVYMKQESLRQFLTGQEDTQRFDAVADMVGASRLRDFATQLESHKRAWARATTQSDTGLEVQRSKLEDLRNSSNLLVAEIAKARAPEVLDRWTTWLADVSALAIELPESIASLSEQSFGQIRSALARARIEVEGRQSILVPLEAELQVPLPKAPDETQIESITSQIAESELELAGLTGRLEVLRESLARSEEQLRREESVREDLASMASILLRHASDTCAACGQGVNESEYRQRLASLLSQSTDVELRGTVERDRQNILDGDQRVRELTNQVEALARQQRTQEEQRAAALSTRQHRQSRMHDALFESAAHAIPDAIDLNDGLHQIANELTSLDARRSEISQLSEVGLQFEAAASLDAAIARYERILAELSEVQADLEEKEGDIAARQRTNDFAAGLLTAVKVDSENFVADRLSQLEPLLGQFYAAIDPHPTFRSVQISTRQFRGKHRLTPVLRDDEQQVSVTEPGETLSTSQANALAVSLFLSFNLGFSPSQLNTIILDDPLQNLDDVHLLGLVDLLRKLLPFRQIIVTTHDHSFAALLARKLRPVTKTSRTTYVRFTKWDRKGPGVEQWDVPAELSPLKLVSA